MQQCPAQAGPNQCQLEAHHHCPHATRYGPNATLHWTGHDPWVTHWISN